ncbi:hypothetical protein M0804_012365 [Polistes exclamans]|nr:hypothetical protein M0804_012365 [Polistes exclamans]
MLQLILAFDFTSPTTNAKCNQPPNQPTNQPTKQQISLPSGGFLCYYWCVAGAGAGSGGGGGGGGGGVATAGGNSSRGFSVCYFN